MSELFLIIKREFRERVRSRAFVIGTVAFPLFMVAIMVLPRFLDRQGVERHIALVDEAPAGVAEQFIGTLTAPPEDASQNRYVVERVEGTFAQLRDQLNARVQAEELDGYVILPASVLEDGRVTYRARNIASFTVLRDIRQAATRAIQVQRLQLSGLDAAELMSLLRPAEVEGARITATGTVGADAESTFWVAYIVAFLIYFMVAFYGMSVLRSVLEDKTSRIAEIMVSSVRATDLMMGKIIGAGAAAVLQVGVWAAVLVLMMTQSETIAAQVGFSPEALGAISIEPLQLFIYITYFVLGFLLYAAIFAALGAAVTSDQESQSLQMVGMVPLFIPLMFIMPITTEPLGGIARTLSLIPLTSPVTMPMRLAAAQIPATEVLLSLGLLVAGLVVAGWLAGKIYRIGILSTGRKPTMAEVVRWLRTA
jgi:ABC-2 type transport system permease protein